MKSTLLILICLLTFLCCFGQSNDLPDIKPDIITLKNFKEIPSAKSGISDIIVIDARFDSSSLGFYQTNSEKNYSIITETSLPNEISSFLKDYLQVTNNGKSIVMVLKKLWLTNECIEEPNDEANKKNANGSWLKGIITKFEFYCSYEDGYTPLYRFDSIFSGTINIKDYSKEYLHNALTISIEKLIAADLNNLSSARKKMTLQDIIAYNTKQFNIPVLNTNVYKKGVYKTFAEFKMNTPSFNNYEIKEDKLTETLFIKDGKGEYPVRDVWGFCDGNNLYIKSSDNYFELTKKQNTFICFAAKDLSRSRHVKAGNIIMFGVLGGGMGKGNKKVSYKINRKLYALDMETGEIY
ncbi:MAG TPA: hypothetical protein VMY77_15095 [Chitinophagaceae bacterium]|nr:hypothetical protein [Chitinophagaceae bacterium]